MGSFSRRLRRNSRGGRTPAFSLVELMVAIGILAFCFLPIITHSRGTVKETEVSQEDLIARHYLIDLVERFKGSSLEELQLLMSRTAYLKTDDMLTDHARVAEEMEAVARTTGNMDAGYKGVKRYLDTMALMDLKPEVKEFTQVQSGLYKLTLAVRWISKVRSGERRVEFSKILVPR